MQSIPLNTAGTSVLDLDQLRQRLTALTDTRHARGLRYPLAPVLLLVVLAKLAGQDRPSQIADWVKHRGAQLRRALHLSWVRMPHHTTYRRVLQQAVAPEELDRLVGSTLPPVAGATRRRLLLIDGKMLRGVISPDRPQGEHLLSAYLPAERWVLLQRATGAKENEITVAPRLLGELDLHGTVVVGDALHTQRRLSAQIVAAGGDYLWTVKANQPSLRADIEHLFTASPRTALGGQVPQDRRRSQQHDKGHGRQECRTLTASSDLCGYSDWPGLGQVFHLERQRRTLRSGLQQREVVYGVTSLTADAAAPAQLLDWMRAYWSIENGLHYRRDVTFQEDRTRQTRGHAGHVMAAINNLVIGRLCQAGATNLAAARRWCDATITLLLAALTA